ncbi:hypothetical protein CDAR_112561 [Caerostris darwini]|uniref:Uncharacterized protein n=1 Tax=Caerostris darwini TaxID=1538125 RepID=A0AAV4PYQ6_9ARAC|nr:hypothetical protein CDAR_112561 [Caerostris darwini]
MRMLSTSTNILCSCRRTSIFPNDFNHQANLAAYKTCNRVRLQHLVKNTHRGVLKDPLTSHKMSLKHLGGSCPNPELCEDAFCLRDPRSRLPSLSRS